MKINRVLTALLLMATLLITQVGMVGAQGGTPPAPSDPAKFDLPPSGVTVSTITSTKTITPKTKSKAGGISPLSTVSGPGGHTATHTTSLSYYPYGWSYYASAGSQIETYYAGDNGKTSAQLKRNGTVYETTPYSWVWGPGSATISTAYWQFGGGDTATSYGQSVVYWYDGTNSYADASIDHTF